MSFEQARKDQNFWNAYWENKDERHLYGDTEYTPEEFYEVWLLKSQYNDTDKKG